MTAVEEVYRTYDRLAALVELWETAGPTDPHTSAAAAPLVHHEARLLDGGRMDEWLDCWSPEGMLWVPLDPRTHPTADQSFYLDDLRRLRERMAWARNPSAWSQHPARHTTRVVSNVEALVGGDASLAVHSSLVLWEDRGDGRFAWCGHQLHRFGPPGPDGTRLIEAKVLLIPALRSAVPHPGALL